jgi:hypothetical protein
MNTFREMLAEDAKQEMQEKVAIFLYLSENDNMINESDLTETKLQESLNDWLKKVGLKAHKGEGLIDYIKDFTKGTGKLIMAAIKGDKDEVKNIADGITKEKFLDFLLKLDTATLHLVTGPIHFIDAITGWHIGADIGHAVKSTKNVLKSFYTALNDVKHAVCEVLNGRRQKKMLKVINQLEYNMPDAA